MTVSLSPQYGPHCGWENKKGSLIGHHQSCQYRSVSRCNSDARGLLLKSVRSCMRCVTPEFIMQIEN